jgi:FtsH-binding integral membrane protein
MLLIRALVAVFLGSRLIWLVTKRWPDSIGKAVFINVVSALAAVIIAAFGFAHGGPPRFNMALSVYGRTLGFSRETFVDGLRTARALLNRAFYD